MEKKHPGTLFGVLAYGPSTRPPVREKLSPGLIPEIAPITYDRTHPIDDGRAPHNRELRQLIEGWAKAAPRISYYPYAYHLAEITAPYPLIRKWSCDLSLFYKNHCAFWQPETLPNFETTLHGLYLGNRLAWNPKEDPTAIIKELNARFYGSAGLQMEAYWNFIDDVWTQVPEYTGGRFGYLRRFTPDVLAKARDLMNKAVAACRTEAESQRVEIANASLRQFELYMTLNRNYAVGNFAGLAADNARWREAEIALSKKYKAQFAFGETPWAIPLTAALPWHDLFSGKSYLDAFRIQKDFQVLAGPLKFRYIADPNEKGKELGLENRTFDDSIWKETDPGVETWSMVGLYDYFGTVWYRSLFDPGAIAPNKKTFLWLGATDGSAEVFVNGKRIPYFDPASGKEIQFSGFCQPVSFDVTAALVSEAKNSLAIRCRRSYPLNELGTGGLLGPVVLYREK